MKIDDIKEHIKHSIVIIITFFICGTLFIWEDPTVNYVPVMWYWQVGTFLSIIFVSKSSIVIWAYMILWALNYTYGDAN